MRKILAFLLCFLVVGGSGYADTLLSFKAGQKAAYTIHQKASGKLTSPDGQSTVSMDAVLGFNLEVISVDPFTGSYPIEVELKVTQVRFEDRISIPFGGKKISYNSAKRKNSPILQKVIGRFMEKPLKFIVHEDFEVIETTGRLEKFEETYGDKTEIFMFGGSEFSYRMILGQIFHLAGKEAGQKVYPVAAYPLANWEEEEISSSSDEYKIADKSQYEITEQSKSSLQASWEGNARVLCQYAELQDDLTLKGGVTWSKTNPLVQSRNVTFKLKGKDHGSDKLQSSAIIHQQWSSRPL